MDGALPEIWPFQPNRLAPEYAVEKNRERVSFSQHNTQQINKAPY